LSAPAETDAPDLVLPDWVPDFPKARVTCKLLSTNDPLTGVFKYVVSDVTKVQTTADDGASYTELADVADDPGTPDDETSTALTDAKNKINGLVLWEDSKGASGVYVKDIPPVNVIIDANPAYKEYTAPVEPVKPVIKPFTESSPVFDT